MRVTPRSLAASAALAALALPGTARAQAVSAARAAAITRDGNGHGALACVSCHGPRLLGNPAAGIPRIAGLSGAYATAQLDAFAAGTRRNAIMHPVASALSPAERVALGKYIARLSAGGVPAAGAPAPSTDRVALRLGERLATRGDWTRNLPACDRCHGPDGVGVGDAFPPLAGQGSLYLSNQLHAWRQHARPGGPLDLMAAIAERMTDADISAVAAYYPTLPDSARRTGGGRR